MSRPTLYIIWLLKNGHERCHAGICTWADVLNVDRYMSLDVMIDLISYHDIWSVQRVSFHDTCISIAFTTSSPDVRWKCNIDFHLRRWYSPTADYACIDGGYTADFLDDDELKGWVIRLVDGVSILTWCYNTRTTNSRSVIDTVCCVSAYR